MKYLLLPLILLLSTVNAQTPCNEGSAGPYPCGGYDLQSEFSLSQLDASAANDSWGWVDPINGNEYALIGLTNGTAFIDVTNPIAPIYLGKLPTHTNNSTWRDIKVYNNYAFIVSEASGHGMQVFDLTRLRNVPTPPETFTEDAHYDGFGNAHNIVINEESGYAYAVGTSTFNGGPHFVNISDPLNPTAAGGYAMDNYSHDAQVVTYCGPDKDYTGKEILIGSNADEVVIVDITDKENPVGISTITYANIGYTHQGWFTEDQTYFLLGDELDELDFGGPTRTIVFDFTDLDDPQNFIIYEGPTPAIDHNGYVNGTKFYMANYRAGMRVIDISDIANGNISEEGFFDSFPNNDNAGFSGAWNVYPYLKSGNIIISDINRGFLLVKANGGDTTPPLANCLDITVPLDENGIAVISGNDIDNGSSDDSGNIYYTLCTTEFTCSNIGANIVELEIYDDYGNREFCTATVTIIDNLPPQIACPDNNSVMFDAGENFYTLPDYVANSSVTATDNCLSALAISQDPLPGTQLSQGNYTISFETSDDEGNTASCSFQLAVEEDLSIDTNIIDFFKIYPNPTSENITISSQNNEITNLKFYNILGKEVLSTIGIGPTSTSINISSLSKGVYFLQINDRFTKKILKM